MLSKNGEDGFGGITRLKSGKEWMLGEVLLSLTIVGLQRSVEDGGEVGMGSRCRRDCGHGVTVCGDG